MAQAWQLDAMREIFGELWPRANAEGRELYDAFPQNSAIFDEQSFKVQGRGKIEESRLKMVSTQVVALWRKHTGTESPVEWSRKHALPAECVLAMDDAKGIVEAVINPGGVSAERLDAVHNKLKKEGVFLDVATAGEKFLKRILPARYLKIEFSVDQLSDWLCREFGDSPNSWLADERLHEAVERFVKQRYATQVRKKAAEKVHVLSDAEVKSLLLHLIDQIPDVGLLMME